MSSPNVRNRVRSPRFPSQGLPDSLRHLKAIYDAVHSSNIDSETAYRLMGFAGKSGSSAKALGSLRQYGLIEGVGDKTRVSDLAFAILEPASQIEKAEAIFDAARNPDVFDDILVRFDGRVPQADEPIRAFLIRDLGFQKKAADQCIHTLRESLVYAVSQQIEQPAEPIEERETDVVEARKATNDVASPRARVGGDGNQDELIIIPLTKSCKAELRLTGKVDDRAISNLIKHIDLLAEVWRETDTLE